MPNFVYRNIKPIYRILKNGDILNIKNGELVEINPETFYTRLLSEDGKLVKVKVISIFANVFLGARTRANKISVTKFYERKFKQKNV